VRSLNANGRVDYSIQEGVSYSPSFFSLYVVIGANMT
jgi:hypothetical protein